MKVSLDRKQEVPAKLAARVAEKDVAKGEWAKLKAADKDALLKTIAEKMGLWKE